MIITVIMLLTLCVGLVFVFMASIENLERSLKKHKSNNENEMKEINHRFNKVYDNEMEMKQLLFKITQTNVSLEKRIAKLEIQILKLNNIDTSKSY